MSSFVRKILRGEEGGTQEQTIPLCPYCKQALEQRPQRKKKCPFCKNFIYARTLPSTRAKVLATEAEAKKIDAEWAGVHFQNEWLDSLEQYGVTKRDFELHKRRLSEESGREPSDEDVIGSLLGNLAAKTRDLQKRKMIYYEIALFLDQQGKDPFEALQQSARMDLMKFKKDGFVRRVSILTAGQDSCEVCRRLQGRVLTIEEALEKMPIPCRECAHRMHDEDRGFCRCRYAAEIE